MKQAKYYPGLINRPSQPRGHARPWGLTSITTLPRFRRVSTRARAAVYRANDRADSHIHLQRGDESLLRDVDLAELAHALFTLLLLLQKLALARHVAAVAFGGHVLAEGAHGLARDDLTADRGL